MSLQSPLAKFAPLHTVFPPPLAAVKSPRGSGSVSVLTRPRCRMSIENRSTRAGPGLERSTSNNVTNRRSSLQQLLESQPSGGGFSSFPNMIDHLAKQQQAVPGALSNPCSPMGIGGSAVIFGAPPPSVSIRPSSNLARPQRFSDCPVIAVVDPDASRPTDPDPTPVSTEVRGLRKSKSLSRLARIFVGARVSVASSPSLTDQLDVAPVGCIRALFSP